MSETPTDLPRDEKIKLNARTLHDSLLVRTGPETMLMAPTAEDLRENLLLRIPDEFKPRIEGAINAATDILRGVKRRDGTPHINHVLRVAIRTIDRLEHEQGRINISKQVQDSLSETND